MRCRVHIYATVRVPIEVEASCKADALTKAVATFLDDPSTYVERDGVYAEDFDDECILDILTHSAGYEEILDSTSETLPC